MWLYMTIYFVLLTILLCKYIPVVLTIKHVINEDEVEEMKQSIKKSSIDTKSTRFAFFNRKNKAEQEAAAAEQAARELLEKQAAESEAKELAEEAERKQAERKRLAEMAKAAKVTEAEKKRNEFDLKKELTKINCGVFFDSFVVSGYLDEGSFSTLTEEQLQDDLHIPKAARFRIVALIEAVKRRMEVVAHEQGKTASSAIEKSMLENHVIGTLAMDTGEAGGGGEAVHDIADIVGGAEDEEEEAVDEAAGGFFTKKADIKRAWEKKMRLLNRRKKEMEGVDPNAPVELPKRTHSKYIQEKIDSIRARCIVDNFGAPRDVDFLLSQYRTVSINPRVIAAEKLAHSQSLIDLRVKEGVGIGSTDSPNGSPTKTSSKKSSASMIKEFNQKKMSKMSHQQLSTLNTDANSGVTSRFKLSRQNSGVWTPVSNGRGNFNFQAFDVAPEPTVPAHVPTNHPTHIQHSSGIVSVKDSHNDDGSVITEIPIEHEDESEADQTLVEANKWEYENNKLFCCDKHQKEVVNKQEDFLHTRRSTHISELQVAIWKADTYKNGFVSREMLKVLGHELLKKLRHEVREEPQTATIFTEKTSTKGTPVKKPSLKSGQSLNGPETPPVHLEKSQVVKKVEWKNISTVPTLEKDVDDILDKCIMTPVNQIKMMDWGGIRERQLKLCHTIPYQQYDTRLFIYLFSDYIADLDVKRLIA